MKKLIPLLFLLIYVCPTNGQMVRKDIALIHVNIFNAVDNTITRDAIILIKNGKIERIGRAGEAVPKDN